MAHYQIHNTTRDRSNRTQRAQSVGLRFKHYVGAEQIRMVRARALNVTEEWIAANLDELQDKAGRGILEVRTLDGAVVDLSTMTAGKSPLSPPLPHPVLDSAANDKAAGEPKQMYPGGTTVAEVEARKEALLQAQAEMAAEEEATAPTEPAESDEVEFTPSASKHGKKRGR